MKEDMMGMASSTNGRDKNLIGKFKKQTTWGS